MRELVSNSPHEVYLLNVSDSFSLLQWPKLIKEDINNTVLAISQRLRSLSIEGIIDIVPTYCSIGIYNDNRISLIQIRDLVQSLDYKVGLNHVSEIIQIPVCYDPEIGIDLEFISIEKNVTIDDLIKVHSTPVYKVNFIGFLPGFMYLSGLDKKLHTPRRTSPRIKIPAGSVAIGGSQTGIYPIHSPGGWHIIGRCPLRLFDPSLEKPCRFQAGDRVSFSPISLEEFYEINEHVK